MFQPESDPADIPAADLPPPVDSIGAEATGDAPAVQTRPLHILLVDDDVDVRLAVTDYLEQEGLAVTTASTQAETLDQARRSDFDLILLDLCLGPESGLDILRELRRDRDLPVIVVTGSRCEEVDRVIGLELGADDYVTKPFSLRELLARINAVLRRRERVSSQREQTVAAPRTCRFAGWTFDRRIRRLSDSTGRVVTLTKGEFALLSSFVDAPLRALTREFLLQATRIHEDIYDRSIDVQILRLRRKLETDPSSPGIIVTERGVGYKFAVAVDHAK